MVPNYSSYLIRQAYHEELINQAERERLARQLRPQHSIHLHKLAYTLIHSIGEQLIHWGDRLQRPKLSASM